MRICPACQTEHESDRATTCRACGHALTDSKVGVAPEDDLEFRVYEKHSDDREFVGGARDFDGDVKDRETAPPADEDEEFRPDQTVDPDFAAINGSVACVPEPVDEDDMSAPPAIPEEEPELTASGKIPRLSEEEVKSIAGSLYRKEAFLSDHEKQDLMKKLSSTDQLFTASAPIEPPRRAKREKVKPEDVLADLDDIGPAPKMAGRGRGIACFYRNIIQLKGNQQLFAGDEITVGGRYYELRRKSVSRTGLLVGGGTAFVIVLLLIGSLLVSDPKGAGRVAGIVLNEMEQPLSQGASVVFPDLGKTYPVNAQGMFHSGDLPSGSHQIEVVRDGKTWASDYITVSGNEISLVSLRPQPVGESYGGLLDAETVTDEQPVIAADDPTPVNSSPPPSPKAKFTAEPKKPAPAALTLAANVDGARLTVDGKVLGAGNLTYRQLSAGTHTYQVSRDGYLPVTGTVTLAPDKTETLKIMLQPLPEAPKQEEYVAEDYYLSGLSAVQERDFPAAIADLSQAVGLEPGHGDAWFTLGKAQAGVKDWTKSHDAFLRAAEIFRFATDQSRAITAYNAAIQADNKSVAAYLGRGGLFLARGDERAAVIDFETAARLDRRNADAYVGLGRSRMSQGMYDQALKHFKDARSIDPTNPVVYQYLMLCYMAENNFEEVKRSYVKFTEVADNDDVRRLQSDERYSAALRVVNSHQ